MLYVFVPQQCLEKCKIRIEASNQWLVNVIGFWYPIQNIIKTVPFEGTSGLKYFLEISNGHPQDKIIGMWV